MRNNFHRLSGLVIALLLTCHLPRATAASPNPTSGLWVGQVSLQNVNETVSGYDASNNVVAGSLTPTPVKSPAKMRIIFHVDGGGQVRLLKAVALVNTNTTVSLDDTNQIILISNPTLYQNYGNNAGYRLTAVAFDFGDPSGEQALGLICSNAATAAVNGRDQNAAALAAQQSILTNIPPNSTAAYSNFLQSAYFNNGVTLAATAVTNALAGAGTLTPARQFQMAYAAAVSALLNADIFTAADALTLNEELMTGTTPGITPGNVLTGTIYLGADHPTNPFRHKFHHDHQHGYAITRELTVTFDSASSSNALSAPGFGVNRITGTYQEQILGLHKPLGPNQNIGLITTGPLTLTRVAMQSTLNQ